MKKLNSRGFTLIELLAVIVILAIVMVLASTSVLPFMRNASRDAFGLEANALIDSASNAVSLLTIGTIDSTGKYGDYTPAAADFKKESDANGNPKYCFSVKYLVSNGLFDLDEASLYSATNTKGYQGTVVATKNTATNAYDYVVNIANSEFYVNNQKNTVDETQHVKAMGTLPSGFKASCN